MLKFVDRVKWLPSIETHVNLIWPLLSKNLLQFGWLQKLACQIGIVGVEFLDLNMTFICSRPGKLKVKCIMLVLVDNIIPIGEYLISTL